MIKIIRILFGYRYVLNIRSNEIHDYRNLTKNCHYDLMVDKKFLTTKSMIKIIKNNPVNGCRWCMKKYDKG